MKILLAATTVYFPSFGGAGKANRALAEQLAARGHTVRALGPALSSAGYTNVEDFRQALVAAGVTIEIEDGVDVFERQGVRVYAPAGMQSLLEVYRHQLDQFAPDCVLLTSEDWQMGLLEIALERQGSAIALLVHGAISLPFGPVAMRPNGWGHKLMSRADAIIAPSRFIKDYLYTHGGLEATLIHLPAFPPPPYRSRASFDNPFVTFINPSAGKGIDIFLEMARRLPAVRFAAVPTWATTKAELRALGEHPNITILNRTANVDEIWSQTRVVLLPSTWPEAFPLTPIEAMLCGIPVLASDVGGTPEAMAGADFVLPVQPMSGYVPSEDPFLPAPVVPAQCLEEMQQWEDALRLLTGDPNTYRVCSEAAARTARQFVAGLSIEPYEQLCERIAAHKKTASKEAANKAPDMAQKLASLTPEQRALLQTWLQAQQGRADASQPASQPSAASSLPFLASERPRPFSGDEPEPGASHRPPASDLEIAIAGIWSDVLGVRTLHVDDNLFEIEAHAFVAAEVVHDLRRTIAPDFPLYGLFDNPTIAGLAAHIDGRTDRLPPAVSELPHIVPLRTKGAASPLFFVAGGGGSEMEYMTAYAGLVNALGPGRSLYGFQAQTRDGLELPFRTVEEMAAEFVAELRVVQPRGPYYLMTECIGAKAGLEMARLLLAEGERIGLLLFLNGETKGAPLEQAAALRMQSVAMNRLQKLRNVAPGQRLARLRLMARNTAVALLPLTEEQRRSHDRRDARRGHIALLSSHILRPYPGDVTILMTPDIQARGEPAAWAGLVRGNLTLKSLEGVHRNYLGEHLANTVRAVRDALTAAQGSAASPGQDSTIRDRL